jgi:tripartite-type tricarboxylate transporter receptor subunit TctC
MRISRLVVGVVSVGLMGLACGVFGQQYPNKPIRVITGTTGGGNDFQSRLVAQGISGPLGQPVIVENRAGNILQAETVIKAPPDGYTLLVTSGDLWVLPFLEKVPYDPVKDFSPISILSREANVVVVHPSLPVRSIKELIALAKAKPGELNFASGSTGSGSHLSGELFKSMAGVNIVRIPYKGVGFAFTELIAGQTQLMFPSTGSGMPHVRVGKLRALAVASAQPTALAPGVPTVTASGLPGFVMGSTGGIFAPAKTPEAVINRLNQEIVRFIKTEDVKEKFFVLGMEPVGSSPDELAAAMKSEIVTFGKVIRDAGIKADAK